MKTTLFIIAAVSLALAMGVYQRSRISNLEGKLTSLQVEQRRLERLQPDGESAGPYLGAARAAEGGASKGDSSVANDPDSDDVVTSLLDELGELIRLTEESGDRQSTEKEGKALMIKLMTLSSPQAVKAIDGMKGRDWPEEMKAGISMMLLTSVMETDPERGMRMALEQDHSGREGRAMLAMLAQQWALDDPEGAAQFFKKRVARDDAEIFDEQVKQMIEAAIVMGFSKRDMPRAFEYTMELEDGQTRNQILQSLSSELKSNAEWHEFLQVAKGIDDPKARSTTVLGMAASLSRRPFDTKFLETLEIPEEMRALFTQKIALDHVDTESAKRADWALEHTEGNENKKNFVVQMVSRWAWKDFNSAAAWLRALPDPDVRDAGVHTFSKLIAKKEPESAIDWVRTIKSPSLQKKAMREVYEVAEKHSPGKAASYLEEVGLEVPGASTEEP